MILSRLAFTVLLLIAGILTGQVTGFAVPASMITKNGLCRCAIRATKSAMRRNLFGINFGGGRKKDAEPNLQEALLGKLGDLTGLNKLGGLGNFAEMQKKAEQLQKEIETARYNGQDANKQVTAVVDGAGKPIDLHISDSLLQSGAKAVSQAVLEALQQANDGCRKAAMEKFGNMF